MTTGSRRLCSKPQEGAPVPHQGEHSNIHSVLPTCIRRRGIWHDTAPAMTQHFYTLIELHHSSTFCSIEGLQLKEGTE